MIAASRIYGFDLLVCSPGASATGPASQYNCCSVCVTSKRTCRSSSKPFCQINASPLTPFDISFEIYQASVFFQRVFPTISGALSKTSHGGYWRVLCLQKAARRFSHAFLFAEYAQFPKFSACVFGSVFPFLPRNLSNPSSQILQQICEHGRGERVLVS